MIFKIIKDNRILNWGKYLSLIVLIMATSCQNINSQKVERKINTDWDKLQNQIPIWQKELNIPNVGLGIIEEGKIAHVEVFGNLRSGDPAPENMLFNVASITKVVFSTMVLKLVEQGKLDLDEPLYQCHIDPDVKDDPRHKLLTARHILSQQSGFVNWRWNHPSEKLTFDFDPGTKYNYSGEGMEYLRLAIENKFEKSLSEIANELLLHPLKMKDSGHSWDAKKNIDRFSFWYDSEGKQHDLDDYTSEDNAADDFVTTVEDLSKFGVDVINGAGLSKELYRAMHSTQAEINPNLQQGLGWRVINDLPNDEYAIYHGGNDIGVATLIVLLPKSKRGLIIFTNADAGIVICNNIVRSAYPEGKEIIHKAYKSNSMDDEPEVIHVAQKILSTYVGQYIQPSGRELTILESDNSLIMKMPGVPNFKFMPESEDTFFLFDFDAKIQFVKSDNGRVGQVNILEGENVIECKRIVHQE